MPARPPSRPGPARRNAGRLLLVEELGQAGRRRHPSAGAPVGGPAAGIALRRVSAAGGRGLAHGSGGDHAGKAPAAGGAGGRAALRRGGGREGRKEGAEDRPLQATALPPPPPHPPPLPVSPGWRRRDRQPPAAEPALREGCRYRPAPHGSLGGAGGAGGWGGGERAGGAPAPVPPFPRSRRPHLGAGPAPSLRRHLPRWEHPPPLPGAARSPAGAARRPAKAVSPPVPGGGHRAGPGVGPRDGEGRVGKSERHRPAHGLQTSHLSPSQGQGGEACILF